MGKCLRHTKGIPEGYNAWHAFAGRAVSLGYTQMRCPDCDLYSIWQRHKKDVLEFPRGFLSMSRKEAKKVSTTEH